MKIVLLLISLIIGLYANETKEILLLHSYNKGLKWSDGISQGVEEAMLKHPEYELTTDYMDSKKIDSFEYFDLLIDLYQKKYINRKYKVIIAADNYAYNFALKNHEKLFHNIPIVFCGVENFNKKKIPIKLQNYVTGVIEYKEIKKNIKLIKKVLPDVKTIYIISDNSFSSLVIKKQILSRAKEFKKDLNIIYDNEIEMETISQKINNLPKNSVILFTSLYRDKNYRYIPYNELRLFFKSSKIPIFAVNKIHLGEGVLGGVMINPYQQGYLATQKAFEILNGKNILNIKIDKPAGEYNFDYNILKKFNINRLNIPTNANIINKPKTFFEKNRELVESAFSMLPLLLFLLLGLIVNIIRRIRVEIKLIEKNKLDNVLLNNVQSGIFWKSNDDILLGCNQPLCNFLNLSKEEIIGKKMKEIMPELCQKIFKPDEFINEIEMTLTNKTKERINVLIKRKQYYNNKNEEAGIITIISDMTKMKKLEAQRKKDEQFIIQRSKLSEIGEMMASVAHQWKNPLVEISAIAQELQYKRKKAQITQEDTDLFVYDIMTQVGYMTNTIDDFRNFIKPSSFKSEFSVNKAVKELLNIIEHNIKYNYIKVNIVYENNLEYFIFGYSNEFKQSILNIINNAKDSIIKRKEKEDINGVISLYIKNSQNMVCINIKDNGLGIPKEKLNSIFEPFITSKKGGDGFGLYMVKLIIEDKMGGSISALECENGAEIMICIKNRFNKIERDS